MSTKARLSLDGLEQYLEALAKAEQDIDAVAAEGLDAGADVLLAGMQTRAPFRMLAEAVRRTEVMVDGNKRYLYLGVLRGTDAETARVANVWEFGGRDTPSSKDPKRKPRPGIVARPFIRPTLRKDAKKAREAQIRVFEDWLKG